MQGVGAMCGSGSPAGDGMVQCDEEHEEDGISLAALIAAAHERWDEMGAEERAFFVYVVQRLRTQARGSTRET